MNPRAPLLVAITVAALTGIAALLVVSDGLSATDPKGRGEQFQSLVGGLGFGPALDLSRCAFSFDPRLCPDCPHNYGPIPGGVYYCPHHACSILYYPPIGAGQAEQKDVGGDASLP